MTLKDCIDKPICITFENDAEWKEFIEEYKRIGGSVSFGRYKISYMEDVSLWSDDMKRILYNKANDGIKQIKWTEIQKEYIMKKDYKHDNFENKMLFGMPVLVALFFIVIYLLERIIDHFIK